jgi:hypothetical protein
MTPAAGGTGTLSIGVARDCAWTAASDAAWVVITSANSGQGEASIEYRVAANTEPAPRRTAIDVNHIKGAINQATWRHRAPVNGPQRAMRRGSGSPPAPREGAMAR